MLSGSGAVVVFDFLALFLPNKLLLGDILSFEAVVYHFPDKAMPDSFKISQFTGR